MNFRRQIQVTSFCLQFDDRRSKKGRENYPRKLFLRKGKETQIKI